MSTVTRSELETLADVIQSQDFDHPFTIFPNGTLRDADASIYAPEIYHSETSDVDIASPDWSALTGMTGQYGYNGAVMHSSEYVGTGIAAELLRLSEDEPQTFVMVVVEVLDDPDHPAGWTILHRITA